MATFLHKLDDKRGGRRACYFEIPNHLYGLNKRYSLMIERVTLRMDILTKLLFRKGLMFSKFLSGKKCSSAHIIYCKFRIY